MLVCEEGHGKDDIVQYDHNKKAEEHKWYQPIACGEFEAINRLVCQRCDHANNGNDESNDDSIDDLAKLVLCLV